MQVFSAGGTFLSILANTDAYANGYVYGPNGVCCDPEGSV